MDNFTILLEYVAGRWHATTYTDTAHFHCDGRSRETAIAELLRLLRLHERKTA